MATPTIGRATPKAAARAGPPGLPTSGMRRPSFCACRTLQAMKIRIDYAKCTGVAACERVCPAVFAIRESDGLAEVLEPEPHPTLWDSVRRAEEACPEEAIVIEEE